MTATDPLDVRSWDAIKCQHPSHGNHGSFTSLLDCIYLTAEGTTANRIAAIAAALHPTLDALAAAHAEVERLRVIREGIAAEVLAEAVADAIEECGDLLAPFSGIGMGSQPTRVEISQWLLNRADAIRALSTAKEATKHE